MAIITIQLGQCGNQIGYEFYQSIVNDIYGDESGKRNKTENEEYKDESLKRWFDTTGMKDDLPKARSVLVDMESKVVGQMAMEAKRSGQWCYAKGQQVIQSQGSGNNWAYGYCVHGPNTKESVLEMVRKEVEKCDYFEGFVTLLSLAGGTGSGLGTYINKQLRDHYPHSFITNQVVWPYRTGEVIVQNYNAILTLSHLYQSSDSILCVNNDDIHDICSKLLHNNTTQTKAQHVSFKQINGVIAQQLTSALQPAYQGLTTQGQGYIKAHLGDMMTHLVSHPQYKLLGIYSIPHTAQQSIKFNSYTWKGLTRSMRQMLITNTPMEEGINWQIKSKLDEGFNKSLSNLMILRGSDIDSGVNVTPFSDPSLYSNIIPNRCLLWSNPRSINQYDKSITLVSNSQSILSPLNYVTQKAWQMFASRAFIHQYNQHGLTDECFLDCFVSLEQIIANYQTI